MGLKPDHWIRKMVLEHKMIEPFEEKQIRDGKISYGVSSYGYDIRVADEFKIFVPVPGLIVDPKHLDERLLHTVVGDHCDIPANSFALARSVEYFRIPRTVLAATLGKSTYARCFSANTEVALVDETTPSLEQMAERAERGEMFWGYSIGENGRIIVTTLEAPRYIGKDALIEIELDNQEVIRCTPDHQFISRDGRMVEANNLRPGDALMPLYTQVFRGYEAVYQPINGYMTATHQLADEWNLRAGIYENTPNTDRHHIDHDRRNNNPWNIMRMDASEHARHHNAETYGEDFDPEEHGRAVQEAIARLKQDPVWYAKFAEQQGEKARNFWNEDAYLEHRTKLVEKRKEFWHEWHAGHSEAMKRYYDSDPAHRAAKGELSRAAWAQDDGSRRDRQREIARNINIRDEITEKTVLAAFNEAGSIRGAGRLLNCDRAVFRRFPHIVETIEGLPKPGDPREDITPEMIREALDKTGSIRGAARYLGCTRSVFRRYPEIIGAFRGSPAYKNHKVVAIRELPGDHDVYCLTVPEAGNFALAAGVFVHNCGIITNITPFEPEWEGFVTLEISNTTPLPARIYANEGIAQVLFFEADEVCETSYADKKGKYQSQTGIVLPRI